MQGHGYVINVHGSVSTELAPVFRVPSATL
jgi:hypothetical protein